MLFTYLCFLPLTALRGFHFCPWLYIFSPAADPVFLELPPSHSQEPLHCLLPPSQSNLKELNFQKRQDTEIIHCEITFISVLKIYISFLFISDIYLFIYFSWNKQINEIE